MIISFLLLWIPAFILHELCHKFEAWRQGCKTNIELWLHNKIPSMRCVITEGELQNRDMFYLAGGLYSGLILLILAIITFGLPWLSSPLWLLATVNLLYSIYEKELLGKIPMDEYMRYHYIVYAAGIAIGIFSYITIYIILEV
jgi:hypothetical protein